MPTLYILVGVPGSGKTTYAKKQFPHIRRIGSDDLRKFLLGKELTLRGHRAIHRIMHRIAVRNLKAGNDVIIDCMNVTRRSRKVYFHLLPKGCRIEAIYLKTPVRQMIRNNRSRSRQIPVVGIFLNRLRLQEPKEEEGFWKVTVEPWEQRKQISKSGSNPEGNDTIIL